MGVVTPSEVRWRSGYKPLSFWAIAVARGEPAGFWRSAALEASFANALEGAAGGFLAGARKDEEVEIEVVPEDLSRVVESLTEYSKWRTSLLLFGCDCVRLNDVYDRRRGMCYQIVVCWGPDCDPPPVRASHYPCPPPPRKKRWWDRLPPCPPDTSTAEKQQYPNGAYGDGALSGARMWCTDKASTVNRYHRGAAACYRQIIYGGLKFGQAGQQCCYGKDGKLITEGPSAGTPDKQAVAIGRQSEHNSACDFDHGKVLAHLERDVVPWSKAYADAHSAAREDVHREGLTQELADKIRSDAMADYHKTHPPWGSAAWFRQGGR